MANSCIPCNRSRIPCFQHLWPTLFHFHNACVALSVVWSKRLWSIATYCNSFYVDSGPGVLVAVNHPCCLSRSASCLLFQACCLVKSPILTEFQFLHEKTYVPVGKLIEIGWWSSQDLNSVQKPRGLMIGSGIILPNILGIMGIRIIQLMLSQGRWKWTSQRLDDAWSCDPFGPAGRFFQQCWGVYQRKQQWKLRFNPCKGSFQKHNWRFDQAESGFNEQNMWMKPNTKRNLVEI